MVSALTSTNSTKLQILEFVEPPLPPQTPHTSIEVWSVEVAVELKSGDNTETRPSLFQDRIQVKVSKTAKTLCTTPAPGGAGERYTPRDQSRRFASWLLEACSALDVAAAAYSANGRVARVEQARLTIRNLNDFERVMFWARAKNSQGLNIWIRPAAALPEHRYLMLDDLPYARAAAILRKYCGATIETSPGNHQLWLRCSQSMNREQRQNVLRRLVAIVGSDPGAISEPRWGRLPGFRQCKPGKKGWTNLIATSSGQLFVPTPYFQKQVEQVVSSLPARGARAGVVPHHSSCGSPADLSRAEFGAACRMLRDGAAPAEVEAHIKAMVVASGRRKSHDYSKRTVTAALRAVHGPLKHVNRV